ncbi:transposase [Chryseobacterium sp. BLS98]|jgi:hypothetical protein|nr:transposase [Chryseobacterium sp. BLS98]
MDRQIQKINLQPDYVKIYKDIVTRKYPEKLEVCDFFFKKNQLSVLDVIRLNNLIFGVGNKEKLQFDQKHKSYDKAAVINILNYQKKNNLNNTELSIHFKLSRNTIAKWKKTFVLK